MKKYILLLSMVVTGCLQLIAQPIPPSSFTGYYQIGVSPYTAPVVSSTAAASVVNYSVSLGGNVTSDGNASVTERGIVYSSSDQTPTIGENGVIKNDNGTGTGTFSETINGLTGSTIYYFRAYAINSVNTTYGTVLNFTTAAPYSGGSGTYNDPYKIATLEDLVYLSEHSTSWSSYFKQTADIDATATSTMNSNGSGGYYGFSPIGTIATWFSGGYNGDGHRVTHLYINRPLMDRVGLFGNIAGYNSFSNLGLDSLSITGKDYVGGLFGYTAWPIASPTMAGTMFDRCYTSGTVTGNTYVGGFGGYETSYDMYTNCYSRCSVTGVNYLGGFVAKTYGSYQYCYVAGVIAVTTNSGPFDAASTSTYMTGCFYDNDIDGAHVTGGYGTIASLPKTTAEMKTQSTFTGASWDFINESTNGNNDYWKMAANTNNGYPAFTWQPVSTNCVMTASMSAQTNVACYNGSTGSLTVTPASGTAPYTYVWSGGGTAATKSSLAAGAYTVTVTDAASCTATASATITEPASAVTVSITSQTNVACNGGSTGSATATGTGGTTSYSFQWSNQQNLYKTPAGNTSTNSSLAAGTYTVTITDANSCSSSTTATITQPTAITASTIVTNVSCNGGANGAVNLTPSGGTGAYTYAWSSGATTEDITGCSATTYTVTITDANSCTTTKTGTPTQPTALAASITSQTNVACYGGSTGSLTATPTGGTTPYSYQWSNQQPSLNKTLNQDNVRSNLAAGTYTVTVTDGNGCTTTTSGTITQPTALTVSITSQTNVACNGASTGSATATGTGGTTDYSFFWSNQQTLYKTPVGNISTNSSLAAGTYTVTITDANSCSSSTTATITQPTAITASTSVTNVSCNGGSNGAVNLTASGGTGSLTYAWSSGATTEDITGCSAATYTVTITDANSCTTTKTGTPTQPTALAASITSQTNVACYGGSTGSLTATPTGGTTPYSYQWSNQQPSFGKGQLVGSTNSSLAAGTYTVTVTDGNGCTTITSGTITQPAAALTPSVSSQTNVACNGASTGAINLGVTGGTASYSYSWSNQSTTEDLSSLAAGTYTVTVTDANSCTASTSATITQATALSVSTQSQTNVACNGGSTGAVTVSVSGGVSPYSYSWSNQQPSLYKVLPTNTSTRSTLSAATYTVTVTDANSCTSTYSVTITQPTALSPGTNTEAALCNGSTDGDVDLSISGGTSPYTYSWSNQATTQDLVNVGATTYTVTITDANSCSTTTSGTVSEPTAMDISTQSQTNVACHSDSTGAVTVLVSGGSEPYSYQWSNQQVIPGKSIPTNTSTNEDLPVGSYTVTVTDFHSCTDTYTVTITEPDTLTGSITTQTNVLCHGASTGSLTATTVGGTGNYSYQWSNQSVKNGYTYTSTNNNLAAGTYTVTITDANNCQATVTETITEPDTISVSTDSQSNVSCHGLSDGAVTVSVSGGEIPYQYTWSGVSKMQNLGSPTKANVKAGTYTVTVTDHNACSVTYSVTITEPDTLDVTLSSKTNVSCYGGSNGSITSSVSGGSTPYSYVWSNQPSLMKTSNFGSPTTSNLSIGTYTVTVTDDHGCVDTLSATISQPDSLHVSTQSQTNISCNGLSDGAVTVSVSGGTTNYLYHWSNVVTLTKQPSPESATASNLAAGTYTVTVTDAHQCTKTYAVTITEPDELEASITSQTNVSCWSYDDGSATVTAIGGTSPYAYSWSGGTPMDKFINSNVAGTMIADDYTVTVTDDHGCTTTVDFTITEPDEITANAGIDQAICYDGEVTLAGSYTVAGGAIWSGGTGTFDPDNTTMTAVYTPSADEIAAGTVTLTLTTTDNGPCNAASDEMIITIYPEPKWTYTVNGEEYVGTPMEFCFGTTVNAVASNFTGTFPVQGDETYYHNNQVYFAFTGFSTSDLTDLSGAMDLDLGAWELAFTNIVDAHGCVATAESLELFSLKAQIHPNPSAIIESNDPICDGETIELYGLENEVNCEADCDLPGGYCSSYANILGYQYISKFKLGKTIHESGPTQYSKTNISLFKTVYLDSTYALAVTIDGPQAYDHYNVAYVDWNRDGDFDDLGEMTQIGTAIGTGEVSTTITVPSDAVLGKTLLRVINRKNFYAPACGDYPVGETENYMIYVKTVETGNIATYSWDGPAGQHLGKSWVVAQAPGNVGGTYSMTVTDINGCSTSTSHDVIVANPQIDFSQVVTDQEAPFIVQLNPGTFQDYSWSNGSTESSIIVNEFGTYTVTVSDYDCYDTESITFNEYQDISLAQGWGMFSTYINQTNNIANVMSAITNSIFLVKNNSGQVYWPAMTINNINNMVIGQGYQVKMSQSALLTIVGTSVLPQNTPVQLNAGINTIGMLRHTPVSAADLFAPVVQDLVYVKLNNGMVYLPQYQVNQVVTMHPDDGFKVMMLHSGVITYPANNDNLIVKEAYELRETVHYQAVTNSGNNMTLVLPQSVVQGLLKDGDEVAVYTANNLLVGSAVYTGETLAMPVWGQDETQQQKSGLSTTESFTLEIFNQETFRSTRFESVEYELGDGRYHENSVAVVKTLNLNLNLNLNLYPNPVVDELKVNFNLAEAGQVRIELYNALGQLVRSEQLEGIRGDQQHRMNVQGMSAGNYSLRMISESAVREASFIVK